MTTEIIFSLSLQNTLIYFYYCSTFLHGQKKPSHYNIFRDSFPVVSIYSIVNITVVIKISKHILGAYSTAIYVLVFVNNVKILFLSLQIFQCFTLQNTDF